MFSKAISSLFSLVIICLVTCENANARCIGDPLLVDDAMLKVAKSIKSALQEEGLKLEVNIGEFTGPPSLQSSGGREIARVLSAQFKTVGVKVHDKAAQQLMGSFTLIQEKELADDDFDSVGMRIEVKILDSGAFGKELFERSIKYFGKQVLQISGLDVNLPPNSTPRERQKRIVEQANNPKVAIVGNETRSARNSEFGVEIRVVNPRGSQVRTPGFKNDTKKSFVELNRNEEYSIVLHNHADYQAAITLQVDGVSMFVDAKDGSQNSRIILNPKSKVEIPGWYITANDSKAFKISGYEDSVAKRVGSTHKVGTITATFQACWKTGTARPSDEPGGRPKGGTSELATAQGRDIEMKYVQLSGLEYGAIRSIVNVRYSK